MYKIFDRRTFGLSHQIKGPVIVNLTILQLKPDLANFTVVGPCTQGRCEVYFVTLNVRMCVSGI